MLNHLGMYLLFQVRFLNQISDIMKNISAITHSISNTKIEKYHNLIEYLRKKKMPYNIPLLRSDDALYNMEKTKS